MTTRLLCLLVLLTSLTAAAQDDVLMKPVKLLSRSANIMAPFVKDSVLYFSSDKKVEFLVNYLDQNNRHFYKLYQVPLKNRLPAGDPALVFANGSSFHQAAITEHPGDHTLLVTQSYYPTIKRVRQSRKINPISVFQYSSGDRNIGRARPLSLNVTRNSNIAYPAFLNNGEVVIFVSDMQGGFGGSDLYFSRRINEGWSEPMNAGSVINTPGNESFPYVSASGKIYFASSGRADSQGMDIYSTSLSDKGFAPPERLDSIYNSGRDDFGLFLSDDEQWGFLTSNRDGNDQIFYFESLFPNFPVSEPYEEDSFCYSFYENSTENYDTLQFGFKWNFSDGTTLQGLEVDHCFKEAGKYQVTLDVFDRVSGDNLFTVSDYEMDLIPKPQIHISLPEQVRKGVKVFIEADASTVESIQSTEYYWVIDNKVKLKGQMVSYVFPQAGIYRIQCGIMDAQDPGNKVSTYREIVVVD